MDLKAMNKVLKKDWPEYRAKLSAHGSFIALRIENEESVPFVVVERMTNYVTCEILNWRGSQYQGDAGPVKGTPRSGVAGGIIVNWSIL